LPSRSFHEKARRARCASGLGSQGLGLQLLAVQDRVFHAPVLVTVTLIVN
jgi:hypothetical protein